MRKQERFNRFLSYFEKKAPDAQTELHYYNAFELLIAVILSAQCRDERVNKVTPELFEKFPTPQALAESTADEVFPYIKSISYGRSKAKYLVGTGKILVEDFNSQIPSDLEDLQKLPGVGRKTANVVASVIYNQPTMAVDTHVFRVSKRIGLVDQSAKTPLAVEKQLVAYIPENLIPKAHHWLILHGRYICVARKPKCEICPLTDFCKYYQSNKVDLAIQ